MSATELLCNITGLNHSTFSNEEIFILEAELFCRFCEELKKIIRLQHKTLFRLINCNRDEENEMIEDSFARCVINDILSTEEYTLAGIAYYTQTPEDIVYELVVGLSTNPSAKFIRKIIELHRSVRKDLYDKIIKKIISDFMR